MGAFPGFLRTGVVTGLLVALLSANSSAQGVLATHHGAGSLHLFGFAVAGAGDVDEDGFDDLLVGAPGNAFSPQIIPGSARVLSGRTGATLFSWTGSAPGSEFGCAVACAGDVDADGTPDLVVGAHLEDQPLTNCGVVRVYSGRTGLRLWAFAGAGSLAEFGSDVAGAGDVDGDGHDDVIVAAPYESSGLPDAGAARVYSGADGTLLRWIKVPGSHGFGSAVAGVGDLDGDGHADVAVGHNTDDTAALNAGAVRVFSGADLAPLFTFYGDGAGDILGADVESAGDVDGDRVPDIAATAPFGHYVRVWSGATGAVLHTFHGSALDEFGGACAGLGDVDGDGRSDIAVGATFADGATVNCGRVTVFSGATGAVLHNLFGDAEDDGLGLAVAAAGDTNRDGVPDLVAGAPYTDVTAFQAGSARTFSFGCGNIAVYGSGCAGSGGFQPALTISGCATPLGKLTVSISQGVGGGSAMILLGLGPADLPFKGGCLLHVFPLLPPMIGPLFLSAGPPGGGAITLNGMLPALPLPLTLGLQAFVIDPGADSGYASTNAVIITMP